MCLSLNPSSLCVEHSYYQVQLQPCRPIEPTSHCYTTLRSILNLTLTPCDKISTFKYHVVQFQLNIHDTVLLQIRANELYFVFKEWVKNL